VLAPGVGGEDASPDSIAQIVEQREAVLIVSVYRTKKEKRGLTRLLDYLGTAHPDVLVFLVQLPDRLDLELTRDYLSTLMTRQDALYSFGASGLLMELEGDPVGLQQKIRLELKENAAIQKRMCSFVSRVTKGVPSGSECQIMQDEFYSLLWEDIPHQLMPGFAPMDERLLELGNRVGDFQLVHRYADHQHVLLAANGQHDNVVLKVYDKRRVTDAKEVECIYQEFCLLAHTLSHPNIIRCVSMLHSQCNVYLVLQYGGDECMEQVLSNQPGYRLSMDDALNCSTQVASAVSYCHAQDIVHGQVSMRHVSVDTASHLHICRLVDFSMAAHAPDFSTRETLCGILPCVSPEMALEEEPYLPKPADCWSLGVVLLETACGQGSLELSVRWRNAAPLAHAAWQMLEFFAQEGCHAEAMTKMGGVREGTTLACLRALLTPDPLLRMSASDTVGLLSTWRA